MIKNEFGEGIHSETFAPLYLLVVARGIDDNEMENSRNDRTEFLYLPGRGSRYVSLYYRRSPNSGHYFLGFIVAGFNR